MVMKQLWIIGIAVSLLFVYLAQNVSPWQHVTIELQAKLDKESTVMNFAEATVGACSTKQRLGVIEQYCQKHKVAEAFLYKFRRERKLKELQQQRKYQQKHHLQDDKSSIKEQINTTPTDWLDELPDEEILRISSQLWMDPSNRLIICLHAKAGSTTWKAILGNNTNKGSPFQPPNNRFIHSHVFARGIRYADNGGVISEIKTRLRTWYKIAIVRHPFDRLVSSYNNKLSNRSSYLAQNFTNRIGSDIMHRYHGQRDITRTVQFQDFIQYIIDGAQNDHWNGPYEDKCHACLISYDYIVKLETQKQDADYIIQNRLRGRGRNAHFNKRRDSGNNLLDKNGRDLSSYFRTISDYQYKKLYDKYAKDFEMYGYRMGKTFAATCSSNVANYTCC